MELFAIQKWITAFVTPIGFCILLVLAGVLLRRRWLCAAAALLLWVAAMPFVAQRLANATGGADHYDDLADAPSGDVIVVLGGTMSAGDGRRLAHDLNGAADRLVESAELHRLGKAPKLLFTGGPVDDYGRSEADGAARIWQRMGVPAEAILLERESRTTRENASFTLPMLREMGARRVLFVTSAWHQRRALRTFKDAAAAEGLAIEWLPVPTDPVTLIEDVDPVLRWLPNSTALDTNQDLGKELLGLAWARLGGR